MQWFTSTLEGSESTIILIILGMIITNIITSIINVGAGCCLIKCLLSLQVVAPLRPLLFIQ